jgi:uncharacterized protein (TIGR03492 family)
MKILVISNGYGEDQIACNLIKSYKHLSTVDISFDVLPLVGDGIEYRKLGLIPISTNKKMPSGGFIRSISSLIKDIRAGLLTEIFKQLKTVKTASNNSDITICIGDIFCLMVGSYKNKSPKVFLPTAKSDLFMKHSIIEIWLMKKLTNLIFPRDEITTKSLVSSGLKAKFFGNPMMDGINASENKFNFKITDKVIGLLPGSRNEAYKNLNYILRLIPEIKIENTNICYLFAKAASLSIETIAGSILNSDWKLNNKKNIIENIKTKQTVLITEDFNSVINSCHLFIGLSGTANEQAIYSGKKVICFEGFGPQSTSQRFREQKKLMGDRLIFIAPRKPKEIIKTIGKELQDSFPEVQDKTEQKESASIKICEEIIASTTKT